MWVVTTHLILHLRHAFVAVVTTTNGDRTEVTQICRQRKARRFKLEKLKNADYVVICVKSDTNILLSYLPPDSTCSSHRRLENMDQDGFWISCLGRLLKLTH